MILIFLVILAMVLIIANIILAAPQSKQDNLGEKGYANPAIKVEEPRVEVITSQKDYAKEFDQNYPEESPIMIAGAIKATNKKINILTERVATLERIVTHLVEKKIESNSKGN